MKSTLLLVLAMISLSACGNAKWKETDGTTPNTDITAPMVPVVTTPVQSIQDETLIFARHSNEAATTVIATGNQTIELPKSGLKLSNASTSRTELIVMVNNQYACTYQWISGSYQAHETCQMKLSVTPGTVISVAGIKEGQTLSMTVKTTMN